MRPFYLPYDRDGSVRADLPDATGLRLFMCLLFAFFVRHLFICSPITAGHERTLQQSLSPDNVKLIRDALRFKHKVPQ